LLRTRKGFLKSKNKTHKDDKTLVFSDLAEKLNRFCLHFIPCFKSKTKSSSVQINTVITSFLVSEKSDCQELSSLIDDDPYQNVHHFISSSAWSFQAVFDAIAAYFVKLLSATELENLSLSIDESGFVKSGKHSAGVAHQYCGQAGKNANSQVGVFSALVAGTRSAIINAALFLPAKWIDEKCEASAKAKIPKEKLNFKSKIDLAYELIEDAFTRLEIPVKWINFDAFYGRSSHLLEKLYQGKRIFVGDIPSNIKVFLTQPNFEVPPEKSGRGRKPKVAKPSVESISVSQLAQSLQPDEWQIITIRKRTKNKPLICPAFKRQVWLHTSSGVLLSLILLIKKDIEGKLHFSLSNALDKNLEELAYMQSCRYFIERTFQNGKYCFGMKGYQVRKWQAWHKHMALSSLTQLFSTEMEIEHRNIDGKHIRITPQVFIKIARLVLNYRKITLDDILIEIKLCYSQ